MDSTVVQVRRIDVVREEIVYDHPTAGAEISEAFASITSGRLFRLPLAKEKVVVELAGVPTAVPNALRRVVKDEIRGRCLHFDPDGFDWTVSTDPFMEEEFVRTRIRMIRLNPQIADDVVNSLRFDLLAVNGSDKVLMIYSGDLVSTTTPPPEPLFNPTYEIGFLQPGHSLCIRNIHIVEGYAYQSDAAFTMGVRAVVRPLDLKEAPRVQTHGTPAGPDVGAEVGGGVASSSGFLESSLYANPRLHELSVYFQAVPPGGRVSLSVLIDACAEVMGRLRRIQKVLEDDPLSSRTGSPGGAALRAANIYFLVTADGPRSKGVLSVRNETDTIGNLITRSVYEIMPEIGYVGYSCIPHEKYLKLTVAHAVSDPDELAPILVRAVRHAYSIFAQIQRDLKTKL
jgi:hypothetical protein